MNRIKRLWRPSWLDLIALGTVLVLLSGWWYQLASAKDGTLNNWALLPTAVGLVGFALAIIPSGGATVAVRVLAGAWLAAGLVATYTWAWAWVHFDPCEGCEGEDWGYIFAVVASLVVAGEALGISLAVLLGVVTRIVLGRGR